MLRLGVVDKHKNRVVCVCVESSQAITVMLERTTAVSLYVCAWVPSSPVLKELESSFRLFLVTYRNTLPKDCEKNVSSWLFHWSEDWKKSWQFLKLQQFVPMVDSVLPIECHESFSYEVFHHPLLLPICILNESNELWTVVVEHKSRCISFWTTSRFRTMQIEAPCSFRLGSKLWRIAWLAGQITVPVTQMISSVFV